MSILLKLKALPIQPIDQVANVMIGNQRLLATLDAVPLTPSLTNQRPRKPALQ